VSTPKKVFRTDEPIVLDVAFRNETDEDIHFIWAQGAHDPWGSAKPEVRDRTGQLLTFSWPMPMYVGAGRLHLKEITIGAHKVWETGISISPNYWADGRPSAGTYTIGVRLCALDVKTWESQAMPIHPVHGPRGLLEIRNSAKSFWSGRLASNTVEITVVNAKDDMRRKPNPPRVLPLN